jgi:uncharacterized glyoxalase superfamily protein PhnB
MIAEYVNYFARTKSRRRDMREPPRGYPRIASSIFYENGASAIDWLCRAFGFEVRLKVEGEGGRIEYSELAFAGGLIHVGEASGRDGRAFASSPRGVNGSNTQAVAIFVDDVDGMCERARAAGGIIAKQPTTTDYGDDYWADRTCEVVDPEGHHWWLVQRMREPGSRGQ